MDSATREFIGQFEWTGDAWPATREFIMELPHSLGRQGVNEHLDYLESWVAASQEATLGEMIAEYEELGGGDSPNAHWYLVYCAYCSLLAGNYQEAEGLYSRLVADEPPDSEDLECFQVLQEGCQHHLDEHLEGRGFEETMSLAEMRSRVGS